MWPGVEPGGIDREVVGQMRGISAIAVFRNEGQFQEILGVSGQTVQSIPAPGGDGGVPYGGPNSNWGEQAGISALAAYYAPDKFDHVIVASGAQVQEWYYSPGPPRVPPPSVAFTVTPDDGRPDHAYFNIGGSATLHCITVAVSR
jgi:hypothetical protein